MARLSSNTRLSLIGVTLVAALSMVSLTGCDEGGFGSFGGYDGIYGDGIGNDGTLHYNQDGDHLVQWPESTWDTWNLDTGDYYNDVTGEWNNNLYPE